MGSSSHPKVGGSNRAGLVVVDSRVGETVGAFPESTSHRRSLGFIALMRDYSLGRRRCDSEDSDTVEQRRLEFVVREQPATLKLFDKRHNPTGDY